MFDDRRQSSHRAGEVLTPVVLNKLKQLTRDPLNAQMSAQRANLKIVPNVGVPNLPSLSTDRILDYERHGGDSHEELREFIGENFLGKVSTELWLTNKLLPHSLREVMLIQAGEIPTSTIHDLPNSELLTLLTSGSRFSQFCLERDLTPRISFSFDPETFDRTSPQSIKRFHVHLVTYEDTWLDKVATPATTVNSLDPLVARDIVEESEGILNAIVREHWAATSKSSILQPYSSESLASVFRIRDGWGGLSSEEGMQELEVLHTSFTLLTGRIARCLREQDRELRLARLQLLGSWMEKNDISDDMQAALKHFVEISWFNREVVEGYAKGLELNENERSRLRDYLVPAAGPS